MLVIDDADPYDNKRNETMYFYTDNDSQLQQLVGKSSYAVTFPKGQLPPVKGFWSLTMYNPEHFFYPNALKRYALGTKNKSLQPRRLSDHLSRDEVAWQREGIQLAAGASWEFFDLVAPIGQTRPSSTARGSRRWGKSSPRRWCNFSPREEHHHGAHRSEKQKHVRPSCRIRSQWFAHCTRQ
jgi:hypothetical protein